MKSYFALAFAKALSTGGEFLNHSVPAPVNVLYLDSELSDQTIKQRLEQFKIDRTNQRLTFITPASGFDLKEPKSQRSLTAAINETNSNVLIIDNLRTSSSIVENASDEFSTLNAYIKGLRDSGITVMVIHHTGKAGDTYAGSSNLLTVFDAVIGLLNYTDTIKQIKVEKDRNNKLGALIDGYFSLSDDGIALLNAHDNSSNLAVCEALEAALNAGSATTKDALVSIMRQHGLAGRASNFTLDKIADFISDYGFSSAYSSAAKIQEQLRRNRQSTAIFPEPDLEGY
jgi:RecA-family ATPase